jgi:dTDP-4-amino-4,6-dideoxygalactose transaminase
LQAALLRVKLPHLERWNERRRQHAASYRTLLGGSFRLLEENPQSQCTYHLFPVRAADRDGLRAELAALGVQTAVHYSPAVPDQPPFKPARGGPWPEAGAWAAEELSLPMFAELGPDEVARVAEACLLARAGPDGRKRGRAAPRLAGRR